MSGNFWANKLGGAVTSVVPAPAAPQPAQQQNSGPWWQAYPAFPTLPETIPRPIGQAPQIAPTRAMVSKLDTNCPDCGGDNYFKPVGMPSAMAQCYECGFNSRFHQTTAGLPSVKGDGTPAPSARQTAAGGAGGRSNYQPSVIIKPDGTV